MGQQYNTFSREKEFNHVTSKHSFDEYFESLQYCYQSLFDKDIIRPASTAGINSIGSWLNESFKKFSDHLDRAIKTGKFSEDEIQKRSDKQLSDCMVIVMDGIHAYKEFHNDWKNHDSSMDWRCSCCTNTTFDEQKAWKNVSVLK